MASLKEVKITDESGNEMSIWMEEDTDGRSNRSNSSSQQAMQQLTSMQDTIKTFATYTLNSFRQIANANVDKVTLKFGINVGGEAGIPYITKGSIGSNLEITVECSFKEQHK